MQIRRVGVKQEWQRERKLRKRPDKAIYQPPRGRERERGEQYTLKVEVAPGHWHTQEVEVGVCTENNSVKHLYNYRLLCLWWLLEQVE